MKRSQLVLSENPPLVYAQTFRMCEKKKIGSHPKVVIKVGV